MGHLGVDSPVGASVRLIGRQANDPISQERLCCQARICSGRAASPWCSNMCLASWAGRLPGGSGDPCDRHRKPVTTATARCGGPRRFCSGLGKPRLRSARLLIDGLWSGDRGAFRGCGFCRHQNAHPPAATPQHPHCLRARPVGSLRRQRSPHLAAGPLHRNAAAAAAAEASARLWLEADSRFAICGHRPPLRAGAGPTSKAHQTGRPRLRKRSAQR